MLTADDLHEYRPELSGDEIEDQLRTLLAKGMIVAVCGDDGPTRFEITHNGKRALEDAP